MARVQLLALLLVSAVPCLGRFDPRQAPSTPKTPFNDDFGTFVDSVLNEFKVPGASIAVIDGNQTFTKGFGYATLPDVKAAPETLWLGASTTKAFVGATLSQFIQEKTYPGLLEKGWNTPISSVITDDFVVTDDWATQHLTLEDAITHRTGLPRHDLSWKYATNGSHTPVRDVVRNLRHLHLTTEPRTVYQYCNMMYLVLSHVIETVTEQPLKTTFKELIWAPLGMASTYLDLQEARNSSHHLATGYYWDNATQSYGAIQHDTLQESGAAGIITSVVDHAKWVRSLLHQTPPLTKAAHADIRTPRFLVRASTWADMDVAVYGLGWQRTTFHGEPLFQHVGQSLSFGTTIWWLPGRQYGVVVMGNVYQRANSAGEVIVRKLIEDAMGIAADKRHDLAPEYKKSLENWSGFDSAVDNLYPNRTDKALPPSASLQDLAGEYYDAGYGQLTFKPAGKNASSLVLVAERPDMVYQYNVRLEHVFGDSWVAFFESRVGSLLPAQAFRAIFTIGSKVSSLDIEMDDQLKGVKPFNVTFNKVA